MPLVWYSLARLGLFALALGLLYLTGLGSWLLILVAAVVAYAASYLLLGQLRANAAEYLARLPRKQRDDDVAEDAIVSDRDPDSPSAS